MDMDQDGVEVKPLVQITGEAEFNEIFMDEAYIPDENVVGGVGNGWGVAITTLMNERAGLAFAAQAALKTHIREAIELAQRPRATASTAAEDPVIRDRLAQLFIESEIFRVTNYRGLTKIMKTGVPGPEGSLGKWQWAEVNQHLMELAMEIEGPYGQFADGSRVRARRRLAVPVPAHPRELDRGRHDRHPQEHRGRAGARPPEAAVGRGTDELRFDGRAADAPGRGAGLPRRAAQLREDPRRSRSPTTRSARTCGARSPGSDWPGLMVSADNGGQELGTIELAVLMEQLGYALTPGPVLLQHARCARAGDGGDGRAARALACAARGGREARHARALGPWRRLDAGGRDAASRSARTAASR